MSKVIIIREETQGGCVGCIADGWYSCTGFLDTMSDMGLGGCSEITDDDRRFYIYKIAKEEE